MGLVHTLTYGLVVALDESLANIQYTLLLADNILSTLVVLLRDFALYTLQVLELCITQSLYTESLCNTLARLTTLVVRRTYQLVLNNRIYEQELVALWVEWEVLELHRTAVKTHKIASLTEN